MARGRVALSLLMLVVGTLLITAGALGRNGGSTVRNGGTFRMVLNAFELTSIDPAIAFGGQQSSTIPLQATCALLLRAADKSGRPGLRLRPEVATGFPKVSRNGKTYTFTLRRRFRFSSGARLTATGFAHAIDRILNPKLESELVGSLEDIVGAQNVLDGRSTKVSGVRARGYKLIIRLTAPEPEFPVRLSASICSVPPNLPVDPEGIAAPLPAAGPYYIADYVPGVRIVLKRNRFYRGRRPHHVDQFVGSFVGGPADFPRALTMVQKGQADWAGPFGSAFFETLTPRERRSAQFRSAPGIQMRYLAMNTSRGIFKNNRRLRRAVNFAIDRATLVQLRGGTLVGRPADQYMPSSMPGFRDVRVYPLKHPALRRAHALARGHTRSGNAVLYAPGAGANLPQAQIVERDLRKIGITVETKLIPPAAFYDRLNAPGEPYDLALVAWGPLFFDPSEFLGQFHGSQINGGNFARFNSPRYNRLLARASRLSGRARYRLYGKLGLALARDVAPLAAYMNENVLTFVSKRTGCVVVNPFLDLAAVCLKR
jgi:ABC-type transport system substrate-binding protein